MRLFEVDIGSARDVLAVLQGQSDKIGSSATIPFPAVLKLLRPFALGINTPDGLIALKNKVDPAGDVIADILDTGAIVLNTKEKNPQQADQTASPNATPNVDAMASSNAKNLQPNI